MIAAQTRSAFARGKTGFHPRIKSEGRLFRMMPWSHETSPKPRRRISVNASDLAALGVPKAVWVC
jgi:hypothetical protein